MKEEMKYRKWGMSWLGLTIALAIHVADEALTDFLPFYNSFVFELRASSKFVPFPTFEFATWLGGLIFGIFILFILSYLAFKGKKWLFYVAVPFSILMILNSLGHVLASFYLGEAAPGVFSSPLLFITSLVLLISSIRFKRSLQRKKGTH